MSYREVIGELVKFSNMKEDELSVIWRIRDFHSLNGGNDGRYASPGFRLGEDRWFLRLWPNCGRKKNDPESGWVRLDLWRYAGGPPKTFHCSVGIRGSGGVEKSREVEKEFSGHDSCRWDHFCSRKELGESKNRLMPGNILFITCVLTRVFAARGALSCPHSSSQVAPSNRSQSSDKRDACTQTECNLEAEVHTGVEQSAIKRGCEKVVEDIAKLLASGDDSDVTVQVGDVEFKVHRNILSVRSPVFSAMLRHETEERATNNIKINDCEPEILREFLHYLYTGSIQSLTGQTVFGLYRVADMYLAQDLKQLCLDHIRDTLCVETFCEAVKLALTHGESEMLQLAIDFATRNLAVIIRSVEWQNFNCEYPREANEILIKCIRP